jgi:hypothetical protein
LSSILISLTQIITSYLKSYSIQFNPLPLQAPIKLKINLATMHFSAAVILLSLTSVLAAPLQLDTRQGTANVQKTLKAIDSVSMDMEDIAGLITRLLATKICKDVNLSRPHAQNGRLSGSDFLIQGKILLEAADQFATENVEIRDSLETNSIVEFFAEVDTTGSSDSIRSLADRWYVLSLSLVGLANIVERNTIDVPNMQQLVRNAVEEQKILGGVPQVNTQQSFLVTIPTPALCTSN